MLADVYNALLAITSCICFWTVFYFAVRFTFPGKSPEWCIRILTMFHGCVVAVTGLHECFAQADGLFQHPLNASTHLQLEIIAISLGYFLFDLVWCLCYGTETTIMLTHHVVSCAGLTRLFWRGTIGAQTVCGMGGMEVTNPLLQLRWFLRSEGFYNTKWYTGVEVAFVVLFLVIRIGFGTCFGYMVMVGYPYDWEFRVLTVAIYVISMTFVRDIVYYISRRYSYGIVTVRIQDVAED